MKSVIVITLSAPQNRIITMDLGSLIDVICYLLAIPSSVTSIGKWAFDSCASLARSPHGTVEERRTLDAEAVASG